MSGKILDKDVIKKLRRFRERLASARHDASIYNAQCRARGEFVTNKESWRAIAADRKAWEILDDWKKEYEFAVAHGFIVPDDCVPSE